MLLDLLGCNLLGILVGNWIIRKYKIKRFHWLYEPNELEVKLSYKQRVFYCVNSVDEYVRTNKWHFLATPLNFLTVLWLVFSNFLIDLSNFFNKSILNLPSSHILIVIRIFVIALIGAVSTAELYEYIMIKHSEKKLSLGVVLVHLILFLEFTLFMGKKPENFFSHPTPIPTKLFWSALLLIFALLMNFAYFNSKKKLQKIEF